MLGEEGFRGTRSTPTCQPSEANFLERSLLNPPGRLTPRGANPPTR